MGENPDDRVIRSYLLGEISADERAAVQQRILEDDDFFERVLEVEQDLTDALARGDLPAADAMRVRAFLDETLQRDRLVFAEALARFKGRRSPVRRRLAVPIAACIVFALAALLLAIRDRNLETRLAQTPSQPAGTVYVAALAPGVQRGAAEPPVVRLPASSDVVEFRLRVRAPGSFERYRVDLAGSGGRPIMSLLVPGPLAAELPVAVGRTVLAAGEYEITLSGLRPDGNSQLIDSYSCELK